MKYVFKNLSCFIKRDRMVCFMSVLSVIVSALIICFSYGVYQNYHVGLDEALAGENTMTLYFSDNQGNYVTKDMLDSCIQEIIMEKESMNNHVGFCKAYALIDNVYFGCNFTLDSNSVAISDEFASNMEQNEMITEGCYWSYLNEREGSAVALCWDYREDEWIPHDENSNRIYVTQHMQEDGTILIGGKKYTIIGYQRWEGPALIPYNSIDGDIPMDSFLLCFDERVTKQTYAVITEIFKRNLGDRVEIEDMHGILRDIRYTYRTVSIIMVLLMLVSAINFTILYLYILVKRKKQTAVFKICGMPDWKVNLINICECMLFSTPLYILTTILYARVLMPRISSYFPYMKSSYTPIVYIVMTAGFIGISVIVCSVMIIRKNRSIMEETY